MYRVTNWNNKKSFFLLQVTDATQAGVCLLTMFISAPSHHTLFVIERIHGNGMQNSWRLAVAVDSLNSAMPLWGSCSRSAILASARPVGSMKLNAIR
jgi:hypothetical protein